MDEDPKTNQKIKRKRKANQRRARKPTLDRDGQINGLSTINIDDDKEKESEEHDHVEECEHSHDKKNEPESVIHRRVKKTKIAPKENPLVQTTKRLKALAREKEEEKQQAIKSKRTAAPTLNDDGVAVIVNPAPKRDPEKPKWYGPMKESANVRTISRFDYQPDICKDYKDTGYCGYGDSCKFMHDRGDYKTGWQLEREWNEEQERKRKKAMGELVEDDENYEVKEDDNLPWACLICKKDFVQPIVTKCQHYFCEACALQHYIKDSRCAACKEQTNGIFNTATRLLSSIEKRKRKLAEEEVREALKKKEHSGTSEAGWAYPKGPESV